MSALGSTAAAALRLGLGFASLGILLVGCTHAEVAHPSEQQPSESVKAVPYVEPAWMEERRREWEEQDRGIERCMRERGWDITIAPDHFYREPPGLTKEQESVYFDDGYECTLENADQTPFTEAEWRAEYGRALDTKACLVNEGYHITDPPSEDSWVQAKMTDQPTWNPFQQVIDQAGGGSVHLTQSQYYDLITKCQQAGGLATMGDARWS